MKVAQINMVPNSSTGRIMLQIARTGRERGHEMYTFSVPGFSIRHPEKLVPYQGHEYVGTALDHAVHFVLGIALGRNGYFSHYTTWRLIRRLKQIRPDVIHLHNIHNWSLNFPMLFRYLKKSGAKVVWTLHDCWTFTGQCPYFDMVGCDKWKTGCYECPQCDVYPQTRIDRSRQMYRKKQKWFLGIPDMTLVTPSNWLAELTKQSYMGIYPVRVIPNGIDLSAFAPVQSDFRERTGCQDRFLILGVSFGWNARKGLDVFQELARRLDDRFRIVLVGTDDETDAVLPENIISIHRTHDQKELAEIYTAADVFVNPTREDNFPTVNLEALACGTPVITFRTGGSPESLDESCGCVVEKDDVDALEREIRRIEQERPYSHLGCTERAKCFHMNDRFADYIDLYEEIRNRTTSGSRN